MPAPFECHTFEIKQLVKIYVYDNYLKRVKIIEFTVSNSRTKRSTII